MVPAKPFTIFTKSSNILFSDCILLSSTLFGLSRAYLPQFAAK